MDAAANFERAFEIIGTTGIPKKDIQSVPLWIVSLPIIVILFWVARYVRTHWHERSEQEKKQMLDAAVGVRDAARKAPRLSSAQRFWFATRHPFLCLIGKGIAMCCVAVLDGDVMDKKAAAAYGISTSNNPRLSELMTRDYDAVRIEDTVPSKIQRARHRTG
ncbi:MAG: hypothetical protein ACREMP_07570 [Candidatus Tyrphobacter sp.]